MCSDEKPAADPSKRFVILAVVAIATVIKLVLAWLTIGTNDVVTWRAFAINAKSCGACAYNLAGPYGDPFNHVPFIIHFLKVLPATDWFPFWLRLPSILADIGTIYLVSSLLPNLSRGALLLFALNPISILISGYHGNIDPIMMFWLVAAIYFVKKENFWLAGIAFGMAINIKVVPLLVFPCFLLNVRKRTAFSVCAIVTVVLLSLPYAIETRTVVQHVLGYRGLSINWGIAHYANLASLPEDLLAKPFRYLIVALGIVIPFYLRRRNSPLFVACATVFFTFYFLTPTVALQYLAWGVPFVAVLPVRWMTGYYFFGGSLIALQYHRWSGGRWIFADSHAVLPVTAETEFLSFALWVCCGAILYVILRDAVGWGQYHNAVRRVAKSLPLSRK